MHVIVTARKRSCGQVMFLQVFISSWVGGEANVTITHGTLVLPVQGPPPFPAHQQWNHHWTPDMEPTPSNLPTSSHTPHMRPTPSPPLLLTSGGHHCWPVQTCSLEDLPLVPTSSGGHWNIYGWEVSGMHPTVMLSCYQGIPLHIEIHVKDSL